ncbi:PaaI family thioesterase [Geomicrobium sediminis]|uniref:Uncharacterized protein (TIGR00369 family) n=1 Tax=Geomicrobium sediminis TaxID=1347788 RepID=A0ABS2P7H5_9BACL|nr:PaaI family thioesterase [Geomicrobium sediminis]MBM7631368.1 uncharacterized protein (TIGR00369 family) [Geomicrobium sediminis]
MGVAKQSPFYQLLGFQDGLDGDENVYLQLEIREDHLNNNGSLHGGVHATMLDNVFGAMIYYKTGCRNLTISLHVHYLAPAREGVLKAKGSFMQLGYKSAQLEGYIYDEDDQLIAKGSGTFKLLREAKS